MGGNKSDSMRTFFSLFLVSVCVAIGQQPPDAPNNPTGPDPTEGPRSDRGTISRGVMKVLDEWMEAFNRMDVDAWERTFHFPHYRLASGRMTVLSEPGKQNKARLKQYFASIDWHHSRWDRRRIIHISDNKVHVDTKFTRYRADGTVIASFESLYILTREDERWGVKMRSSFAR